MGRYDNIINMEHHVSKVHPQMSIESRSAQFAPFATLTGYSDTVKEEARLTNRKIELDEEFLLIINTKLQEINNIIKNKPTVIITYFIKDRKKQGGRYENIIDNIKRIDDVNKIIYLINYKINIDDILNIEIIK
jgi:hypothetical protein